MSAKLVRINNPARKAALQELEDKRYHASYLFKSLRSRQVPMRPVTRETIHAQRERAELQAAFLLFQQL